MEVYYFLACSTMPSARLMIPFSTCVRKAAQQLSSRCSLHGRPTLSLLLQRGAWIAQSEHVRSYHGTAATTLSVRRRRTNARDGIRSKPDSSDEDDSNETLQSRTLTRSDTDPILFVQAATALLDKLHTALTPLVPINDNMILTRGIEKPEDDNCDEEANDSIVYGPFLLIDLGPVDGQYSLTIDALQSLVLFHSPISGQRVYQLSKAGDWCCVEDGHNLEGILVRDLIRQIQGVPNL